MITEEERIVFKAIEEADSIVFSAIRIQMVIVSEVSWE